jgi:hypothetical protein
MAVKHKSTISLEDYFFGRVAVALGFITPEELRLSLRLAKSGGNGKGLQDVMIAEGLLDQDRAEVVRREKRRRRSKRVAPDEQLEEERALGQALVSAGLVALADLEACLLEKEQLARRHVHVHLGEVLINRNLVRAEAVHDVLRARRGEVRLCETCNVNVLVHPHAPESTWVCPTCGERLSSVSFLQPIETDGEIGGPDD